MDTRTIRCLFLFLFPLFLNGWGSPVSNDRASLEAHLESYGSFSKAPLPGGNSYDTIFKIKGPYYTWVLRALNPKRSFKKRKMVCEATQIIGEKGLGPKVIWYSDAYYFLITEFVEGSHLTSKDIEDPFIFRRLVWLIKKSHKALSHLSSSLKPYPLKDRALRRLSEIKKHIPHSLDVKVRKKIEESSVRSVSSLPFLAHNDIKGPNILRQGRVLFLIDWGEGGPSSLYDDLGKLAFHFNLNTSQEDSLLTLYHGRNPTEDEKKVLENHRWLAGMHQTLWKLRRGLKSKKQ
ncbi:phosphotransferase [Alphaproteobacteria bacterium]|nr:phosphotransferase [Alphaproteobacteria bacterium]